MSSDQYQRAISLGCALYGPNDPSAHTFDVIVGLRGRKYVAYLIAYVMPNSFAEWKVFMAVEHHSRADVVGHLLSEIQEMLDSVLDGASVNGIWDGSQWT